MDNAYIQFGKGGNTLDGGAGGGPIIKSFQECGALQVAFWFPAIPYGTVPPPFH